MACWLCSSVLTRVQFCWIVGVLCSQNPSTAAALRHQSGPGVLEQRGALRNLLVSSGSSFEPGTGGSSGGYTQPGRESPSYSP